MKNKLIRIDVAWRYIAAMGYIHTLNIRKSQINNSNETISRYIVTTVEVLNSAQIFMDARSASVHVIFC